MQIRAPAIVCAARPHGETASIVRLLTRENGLLAGYVAGGRGRHLRPVLIPGNEVAADLAARSASQLPSARLELTISRAPWMTEPLPAAAIGWACALTAATLPERHPYPALFDGLGGLLDAICHAPSARGWAEALLGYEALLLRDMGYGEAAMAVRWTKKHGWMEQGWVGLLAALDRQGEAIGRHLLAGRAGGAMGADVMAARQMLRQRLGRIDGEA